MKTTPHTITRQEAAAVMSRTLRTIDNMRRDGRLVSAVVNGATRISTTTVNAVLSQELHERLTGKRRRGKPTGTKHARRRSITADAPAPTDV